jgi:hypothetical protein
MTLSCVKTTIQAVNYAKHIFLNEKKKNVQQSMLNVQYSTARPPEN